MIPPKKNRAISALSSTLLFIIVIVIAAGLLYTFTNEGLTKYVEASSEVLELRIRNVGFNQSCMKIHITNTGDKDAIIENVYINKELRAFRLIDNDLKIPVGTEKEIYIFGTFNPGCQFKIKAVFESGYAVGTMERY